MINYVKGNIFESQAQALVNTVNTVGVMGKGLALQFKEAFPENFRIYRDVCKNKQLAVGQMLVTEDCSLRFGNKIIVNFPTKTHWRYPSEYSYIELGLKALRNEIRQRGIRSIAIPPLGSHNGGLDWQIVRKMVEDTLANLDCDIYLYEPDSAIVERMKSERVKLTPARALLLLMFADMNRYGEFASVFAAEKLVYFLQRFGAGDIFKIQFKPYIYGPYSGGKIAHVLYHLNGSYIKGMAAMNNRPFDFIWLTEDAEKEAKKFIAESGDRRLESISARTMEFLRDYYSNFSLELLSSVDYLLGSVPSLSDWKSTEESQVIDILSAELLKWSPRKENMFKPQLLSQALTYLKTYNELGLV